MSKIRNTKAIIEKLKPRSFKVKNIDKLILIKDEDYVSFLLNYQGIEITPDVNVFGYEKAIVENQNFQTNYPTISCVLWVIGDSGQGDSWFIDKRNGEILFYDHNQGECENLEQFVNLKITFFDFLKTAFLYQELELILEYKKVNESEKKEFKNQIDSISPKLFDLYPFKYW